MVSLWTESMINDMRDRYANGTLQGTYGESETAFLYQALSRSEANLRGGRVLVIGSENPWVEACAIAAGAATVSTLEYGSIKSLHPQVDTYTPDKFREKYLKGLLPLFDSIISYSSIEHSGLGRYGDILNPYGDLQTIARAWCVTKTSGRLILAIPGKEYDALDDAVHFNLHRVYGSVMYSHLFANWRQLWRTSHENKQRVYVLSKIPNTQLLFCKVRLKVGLRMNTVYIHWMK